MQANPRTALGHFRSDDGSQSGSPEAADVIESGAAFVGHGPQALPA